MSLIGSLYTSMSALQTTQALTQITSANIANVNTPGYTKKNGTVASLSINGQPSTVKLADIQRTVDEQLLRQIRVHIARLSGYRVEDAYLSRTQDLFGSPADDASLTHRLTDLAAAFELLATAPDSAVNRSGAIDTAAQLADQLNYMTATLQQMRVDADGQIAETVEAINTTVNDIADLNLQIATAIAAGQNDSVGDLRDQRDVLITELSGMIDIQYFEKSNGEVSISTLSGRLLIGNLPVTLGFNGSSQVAAETTHGNGLAGVLYGPAQVDITGEIRSGSLATLIELRDRTLVDLQAEIDRLTEALRDGLNAIHNDGTAFPPPTSLTGTRSVAAGDAPPMTGTFRVAVTGADGVVVETLDIDLSTLSDIGDLVAAVDGMTNATATIDASGKVQIAATAGNRIAVNDMDSAVATGNDTRGMSHFLGLNDFLDSGDDYDRYTSDRIASSTSALGLAGTLTFSVAGVNTNVAYAAGDSLQDIADAIDAALGGAGIAATVVKEGAGYRLEIADAGGDNFYLSDSGPFTGNYNLHAGRPGAAGRIEVLPSLVQNPNLLASGELSAEPALAAGAVAIAAGDGTVAQRLAGAFSANVTFGAAGGLAGTSTSLTSYATGILSRNATLANAVSNDLALGESFQMSLETRSASLSQVNLDEELSQLILLQNAYSAAGRLTSVIDEMMDALMQILR